MKKLLFVLLIFTIIGTSASAVDLMSLPPPLESGDILVDAGVGFITSSYGSMKIPPLFVQGEYVLPVPAPVSVGASFSFYRFGQDFTGIGYSYSWAHTYMSIMARGNWHFNFFPDVNWLDLYGGVTLGYRIHQAKYSANSGSTSTGAAPSYSGLDFGGQIGAHFYFTDMIGAVAEFGYPYFVKGGVALKF